MAKEKVHDGPHKYKRKWLGKNHDYEVFACVKTNCMHYIRPELLEGKEYECWRCGATQIAGVNTRLLAKPHCRRCKKGKERNEIKSHFKSTGHLPEIDLKDLL